MIETHEYLKPLIEKIIETVTISVIHFQACTLI